MTDKEKIIAEIERLKEIGCPLQNGSDYQHGYDEFYTQIKTFINSLPAEQTAERLGDEIDNFRCSDEFALAKRAGEEITVTAQHFAQWQKEKIIKKACEWLKTNGGNYWLDDACVDCPEEFIDDFLKTMEDEQ